MKNSKEYYNSIAKTYSLISNGRLSYLNAIDDLIVEKMKTIPILNYIDIGSGDGRRALKIARTLKPSKLSLLDYSDGMLNLIDDDEVILHQVSFLEFESNEK